MPEEGTLQHCRKHGVYRDVVELLSTGEHYRAGCPECHSEREILVVQKQLAALTRPVEAELRTACARLDKLELALQKRLLSEDTTAAVIRFALVTCAVLSGTTALAFALLADVDFLATFLLIYTGCLVYTGIRHVSLVSDIREQRKSVAQLGQKLSELRPAHPVPASAGLV
jgi:hypothetical protein